LNESVSLERSALAVWSAPALGALNFQRDIKKPEKGESDRLLPCCGLLCRLFRWHRPRCGSSRRCFFPSEISHSPFALGSYTVLLSHGLFID
jgi:hypothetical protein